MRLIACMVYLGIGAMFHAVFIGAQFDWTSAWTLGWLLGWPIMLIGTFWAALIIIAVVVGLAVAIFEWIRTIAEWRARRRRSRA